MADFIKAFSITEANEGGYVDDPDDRGGETFKGISRRFHPSWSGWQKIDELKKTNPAMDDLKKALNSDKTLQSDIQTFYKQQYWDPFWGDKIPNQDICDELFDTGVNMGVRTSVRYLQESLNLLNRNQKNYPDIIEDGLFGPASLMSVEAYLRNDDNSYPLKLMNILQGFHYIEIMKKNPVQEKFARGWLKRINISK